MDSKTVIDLISSGAVDADLLKIVEEANKRLKAVRANKKISDFEIGDRVRFNENTGTRYMVGQYASIVSKNRTKVVVRLETPMGRFARINPAGEVQSVNVTVPLAIIDPA